LPAKRVIALFVPSRMTYPRCITTLIRGSIWLIRVCDDRPLIQSCCSTNENGHMHVPRMGMKVLHLVTLLLQAIHRERDRVQVGLDLIMMFLARNVVLGVEWSGIALTTAVGDDVSKIHKTRSSATITPRRRNGSKRIMLCCATFPLGWTKTKRTSKRQHCPR